MIRWPHDNAGVSLHNCLAFHTESSIADAHVISVMARSSDAKLVTWRFHFAEKLGMAVTVYASTEFPVFPSVTHSFAARALINVLASCILTGEMKFPSAKVVVTSHENQNENAATVNVVIVAARAMARRLRATCLGFGAAARAYRRRDGAARYIQRAWKVAVSDPSRQLCRERLMREFEEDSSLCHLAALPAVRLPLPVKIETYFRSMFLPMAPTQAKA